MTRVQDKGRKQQRGATSYFNVFLVFNATLGYISPEYGQAWVATLRGDVYIFGVVMFELLTGKRQMEVFRPKMSREIVAWVHQMRREEKPEEVFDALLRKSGQEKEMLRVLDIACMCVNQNPMKRPVIQQVVD
ncbi:hypothetical protein F2Q68_00046317 [Brassica cretica]|uniref:Protein kinase domain-containing protein n=1 Tax=Brassica cretica TaxID=69181 RepID=A0A8S9LJ47_BRACR|nr:hypothetical protein F2Q68_00046317 [Brassica cretica]